MKLLKNIGAGKILTSVFVVFMLSFITLLSSCTTTVRTPRYARRNIVIERQYRSDRHDNGLHLGHYKQNKKSKHHH